MTALPHVLQDLRAAGIAVWPSAGQLQVLAPAGAFASDRQEEVARAKPTLLAFLESEVRWREDAMRRQSEGRNCWPYLVARHNPMSEGHCLSCGDKLAAVEQTRCSLCLEAIRRVMPFKPT